MAAILHVVNKAHNIMDIVDRRYTLVASQLKDTSRSIDLDRHTNCIPHRLITSDVKLQLLEYNTPLKNSASSTTTYAGYRYEKK